MGLMDQLGQAVGGMMGGQGDSEFSFASLGRTSRKGQQHRRTCRTCPGVSEERTWRNCEFVGERRTESAHNTEPGRTRTGWRPAEPISESSGTLLWCGRLTAGRPSS